MPAPQISNESRSERLERGQEYRFEVDFNIQIDITLKQGQAEIFGTEITTGPVYSFSGTKGAVYTWQGCEIEIRGTPASAYVSDESPMMAYLNCHFALDRLRLDQPGGPKVLVVGPSDSGKTSLVKILAAYALKLGRHPLLVNLDPREGMATMPGSLSAIPMTHMLDVSDGFGSSGTTGSTQMPPKIPVSYCYGAESPSTNVKYYKHLVSRLSLAVNSRLSLNQEEKQAGLIIDTSGLIDQNTGYDIIHACVTEFEVNVVICLGSERLAQDLIRKYDGKSSSSTIMTVLKLPKSGGCVGRDAPFLANYQKSQMRRYFYGEQNLHPFSISVSFDDLVLFGIESSMGINTSLMPIGMEQTISKAYVASVEPSGLLLNTILAILHSDTRETLESISESNIMGYLLVTDVDDEKRRMTLLAPFQGRLPSKALLVTSYRYSDD